MAIIYTGATASLKASAKFLNVAAPKFALRAIAQSMARELSSSGIHVSHVILDGIVHTPQLFSYYPAAASFPPGSLLEPDAVAETLYALHAQSPDAWTHELELRPKNEEW